jgi:hypothetical protein
VNLVLRIMEAYSQGDYTAVPSGTYGGQLFSPSYSSTITQERKKATVRKQNAAKPNAVKPAAAGSTGAAGATGSTGSTGAPSAPAPKPASGGDPVSSVTNTVTSTVTTIVKQGPIAAPEVSKMMTNAQATVACLQTGLTALDVAGLASCIAKLMG